MSLQQYHGNQGLVKKVSETEQTWTSGEIQAWQWPNVLSLDAVSIGLFWQITFTFQFCGRMPLWYETAITCISIWLVYVADRLLDSKRIDSGKPHSLRHGFHQRNRSTISLVWFVMLCVNTFLVFKYPSYRQLRWGAIAVGAVSGYLVLAQCCLQCSTRWQQVLRKWIPKEVCVGGVFSFGMVLVPIASGGVAADGSLFIAWAMASALFAVNCSIVSMMESCFDRAQRFSSVATQFSSVATQFSSVRAVLISCLCAIVAVSSSLCLLGMLGRWVSLGLCTSSIGMLIILFNPLGIPGCDHSRTLGMRQKQLLVLATDLATLLGPLLVCLWIQIEHLK